MQKFLNYFITICAVIIGLFAVVEGIQSLYQKYHNNTAQVSSSSKQEMIVYLQQIAPIAEQVSGAIQEVAPVLDQAADPSKKEMTLAKVKSATAQFASYKNQAAHVQAPQAVKNLHQQWVDAIGSYVGAFQQASSGVAEGNKEKISEGISMLEKGSKQFNDISQEIAHQVPEK